MDFWKREITVGLGAACRFAGPATIPSSQRHTKSIRSEPRTALAAPRNITTTSLFRGNPSNVWHVILRFMEVFRREY
jgi:hypothetical protein